MLGIASCGPVTTTALKGLVGNGPSLEAQVGKENTKVIGISEQVRGDKKTVEASTVETVVVQQIPPWILLLLLVGWILPSPQEMARSVTRLFKRNA